MRRTSAAGVEHFTAHPHTDPDTGVILGVGYRGDDDPSCTLYQIGADGRLESRRRIEMLASRSLHDMAFTADRVVVWDLPLEFDHAAATAGAAIPFGGS